MRYCPFCGTGLDNSEISFCPRCGKKYIKGIDNPESDIDNKNVKEPIDKQILDSTDEHISSNAFENNNNFNSETSAPINKAVNKHWIIAVLIALIIIIASIFTIARRNNKYLDAANSVLYIEAYDIYDNLLWSGSGFLINDSRTIVTNYHVISPDGLVPYKITAFTPDGYCSSDVETIINYSEDDDLAIIQCSDSFQEQPLKIGDSSSVKQGDAIYAIGYPQAIGNTISDGIVSAIHYDDDFNYLQISAPISHGSSGGPIVNKRGEVIGIACASITDSQNLNLAIKSDSLNSLINETPKNISLSDLTFAKSDAEKFIASYFKCKQGSSCVYIYGYLTAEQSNYTNGTDGQISYYLQPDYGLEPKIQVFFSFDYQHYQDEYVRLSCTVKTNSNGNIIITYVKSVKTEGKFAG